MKKINKVAYRRAVEFLNRKTSSMIFFYLFFLTSVPLVTYKPIQNFWYNLYYSFGVPLINTLFFLLVIVSINWFIRKRPIEKYIVHRIGTYKDMIICDLVSIIYITSILFAAFSIFNLSFSILGAGTHYSLLKDSYEIILPVSICIELVKYYAYVVSISFITYFLSLLQNQNIRFLFLGLLFMITIVPPNQLLSATNIFETSIQYTFFINHMGFSNFYVFLVCSMINLFLYLIVTIMLYRITLKKRGDLA